MNLLSELHRWYLEMGPLSVFAWIGTAILAAFVVLIVVAVTDFRLPRLAGVPKLGWLAKLRARNERILREREALRG